MHSVAEKTTSHSALHIRHPSNISYVEETFKKYFASDYIYRLSEDKIQLPSRNIDLNYTLAWYDINGHRVAVINSSSDNPLFPAQLFDLVSNRLKVSFHHYCTDAEPSKLETYLESTIESPFAYIVKNPEKTRDLFSKLEETYYTTLTETKEISQVVRQEFELHRRTLKIFLSTGNKTNREYAEVILYWVDHLTDVDLVNEESFLESNVVFRPYKKYEIDNLPILLSKILDKAKNARLINCPLLPSNL